MEQKDRRATAGVTDKDTCMRWLRVVTSSSVVGISAAMAESPPAEFPFGSFWVVGGWGISVVLVHTSGLIVWEVRPLMVLQEARLSGIHENKTMRRNMYMM